MGDSYDRYEKMAAAFYSCYGFLAPGKDSRTPIPVSESVHFQLWVDFVNEYQEAESRHGSDNESE